MLHGGDLAVGDAVPPAAGPGAGDQPLAQVVGNLDPADANAGDEGEHDPIRGTRFAYSEQVLVLPGATPGAVGTVNQGDPYLTVTYVTDETDKSVSVDVVGLLSSVSIRMKTNGDDATHVPGTVHATYSAVWVHNDKDTKHDDPPPPDPDGGGDSGDGGAGGAGDPTGDGGAPPGGDGRGAPTPA